MSPLLSLAGIGKSYQLRRVLDDVTLYLHPGALLLDEPTNDFSFDVVEGLEAALASFPGAIVAASHDRRFIARFLQSGGTQSHLQDGMIRSS
ncbi:MAG: hypothetical protein SGJ24_06065 [Chloroflexota bacterium]|nr:hypothetical protein [Chloroflexota bacterium]